MREYCLHEGAEVHVDGIEVRTGRGAHGTDTAEGGVDIVLGDAVGFVFEHLLEDFDDHPELENRCTSRKVRHKDGVGLGEVEGIIVGVVGVCFGGFGV